MSTTQHYDNFKEVIKEDLDSKSQNVILKNKGSKNYTMPTVFTEQGAYALSFVLKSTRAVEMGVFIARALLIFVDLF